MGRKVVVLTTIHAVQGAENRPCGTVQDPDYRAVIENLAEHYSIDAIFEEACACGPTTAEKLAKIRGLRYLDVDSRAYRIEIDTEEGPFFAEEKLDAQVRREEFVPKNVIRCFLCVTRRRNDQARIRFESINPRLQVACGVAQSGVRDTSNSR
jgi:hypothetical protein